jgi:hypothetical protein
MFGKKKTPPPDTQPILNCSFCNKSQRQVKKLVAGPKVNICDECVDICLDIISEDRKDGTSSDPQDPSWPSAAVAPCALCCLPTSEVESLVVHERGVLCPGCLGEIQAAVAERQEDAAND